MVHETTQGRLLGMLGTYYPHFTRFRPPNTPSRRPPTTNRAKSDSITGHSQSHRPRIRCLYATDSHCRHQACCCTASITEDSSRRSEHLKDATRLLPRAQWVACSQAPLMAEREGLMSCARHRISTCVMQLRPSCRRGGDWRLLGRGVLVRGGDNLSVDFCAR